MNSCAVEQMNAARPPVLARILETLVQIFTGRAEPSPRLHLDEMPDRFKRDLGFLDGREPRYEDERTR